MFFVTKCAGDFAFEFGNLLQTSSMATFFKRSLQPDPNHLVRQLIAELIGRQTDHIRVIVQPTVLGRHTIVTWSRTDAGKFIRGDTHSDPGPTDQDPAIDVAIRHFSRYLSGVVRIVDAL